MPDQEWFEDGKPVTDLDFARAEARLWREKARMLEIELAEARKSQGYSPKPHWEPHWDRGSKEEV